MVVLSLFDGCSIARLALNNLNIQCSYYSSEIDKYCISVSQKNFSDIILLGDINNYQSWKLPKIDLLIGGSPCQNLSKAGDKKGLKGTKSSLFYRYLDVLDKFSPNYYVFENVKCSYENKDIISSFLGKCILINSSLVTAQDRKRFYWSNFNISQLVDRNIKLQSILENNVDLQYYYSNSSIPYIIKKAQTYGYTSYEDNDKSATVLANWSKGQPNNVLILKNGKIRKFTPIEAERLQSIPDNYTNYVSKTQRYKMIGNAFTTSVVEHIIKEII